MHEEGEQEGMGLVGDQAEEHTKEERAEGFTFALIDVDQAVEDAVDDDGGNQAEGIQAGEEERSAQEELIAEKVEGPIEAVAQVVAGGPVLEPDLGVKINIDTFFRLGKGCTEGGKDGGNADGEGILAVNELKAVLCERAVKNKHREQEWNHTEGDKAEYTGNVDAVFNAVGGVTEFLGKPQNPAALVGKIVEQVAEQKDDQQDDLIIEQGFNVHWRFAFLSGRCGHHNG